jgi:purine-nucleoside phosphorylase
MNKAYEKLVRCEKIIREKTDFEPEVALVLGSGLGGYASNMDVRCEVPYSEIEGFPVSTVPGHDGRFLFGYVKGVPVVAMKGRIHYYEGYDMTDIVLPIRLMGMLGAKTLVLTNAAGGINMDFTPGDLMIIKDHISAFVPSPLRGENLDELGPRFPDMSKIYDRGLMEYLRASAAENGFEMKEGVYLQFQGPNFETPTEIKMFRGLGADAVGMSTVCEAITARHMGLRIAAVSCITNMAAGILDQPLSHEEVQETADKVADKFEKLITGLIARIGEEK